MTRFLILTLLATLLCSTTAYASTESHRQAVEEMLTVSQVDKMFEPMMDNFMTMFQQQMSQLEIPEDKKPIIEKYNQEIVKVLREELQWEKTKDEFIAIYLNVYTEEEVRELTKFYTSPIGQKMIDKMPALMQESMKVSQSMMQQALPRIQALSQQMAAELQATE